MSEKHRAVERSGIFNSLQGTGGGGSFHGNDCAEEQFGLFF